MKICSVIIIIKNYFVLVLYELYFRTIATKMTTKECKTWFVDSFYKYIGILISSNVLTIKLELFKFYLLS